VRAEIEKYLGTVMQSTAKTISEKLCMDRLLVSRELNAMVSSGILERKLEGNGPRHTEYVYWLTRKDSPTAPQDGVDMHPKTFPAGVVSVPKSASPVAEKPEITETEVSAVEQSLDLALQLQAVTKERDAALGEVESQKEVIAKLRANNAELERKIDDLTIVDAEFVPSQVFVTIGRTAAPKRHKTLEKAQRRANLLVRTEKESEVLVLEPVGRVVRGAEWRSQ
jgi:hypothetical protein